MMLHSGAIGKNIVESLLHVRNNTAVMSEYFVIVVNVDMESILEVDRLIYLTCH